MGKYIKSLSRLIVLLILLISTFCIRYKMYSKSSHPTGLDGYYYALQAKSFSETGKLENPDIECGYYLCGIFAKLCGNPIKGVKIWDSISSTLTSAGSFLTVFLLTSNFFYSLLAFILVTVSPLFTLMGINYINNQTGLMFFFFFISCLIFTDKNFSTFSIRKKVLCTLLTIILFIFTALSHKVSLIYGILIILIYVILKSKSLCKKILSNKTLLICFISAAVLTVFLLILFFIRHFPRFQNSFLIPETNLLKNNFLVYNFTLYGIYEIYFYYAFAYILLFCCIFRLFKKRQFFNSIDSLLLILIPFFYFPFWNLYKDMGIRMVQNSITAGIPLTLYLIYSLKIPVKKVLSTLLLSIIIISLYIFSYFTPNLYDPKFDPPYSRYKEVIENIKLSDSSLLIAHLGLNHVYTYYKNLRDCLNWNCDFKVKDNDIWRIAKDADSYRIKNILKANISYSDDILDENIKELKFGYILIKEELWQDYLRFEDSDIAETYKNFYNPHEVRPEFIRRKKR